MLLFDPWPTPLTGTKDSMASSTIIIIIIILIIIIKNTIVSSSTINNISSNRSSAVIIITNTVWKWRTRLLQLPSGSGRADF